MSELRPLFGEDYVNAYGFNEETVQLAKGNIPTSMPSPVERRLTSSSAVMEDSGDIKGLCKALHVTEAEMLTLQQNGLKNFETLVKFINDNVTSKTLVCSIYIITHEINTKERSKAIVEKNVKQISKILLGHYILMCIPLETTTDTDTIETVIKTGIEITPEVLQSFQQEATAIFDYEEIQKKSGADIIKDSRMHVFGETKALLAELTEENLNAETSAFELGYYFFLIAGGTVLFLTTLGFGKK